MLGFLYALRNTIWPASFSFKLEYGNSGGSSRNSVAEMIQSYCPSLSGMANIPSPTRWLPSGHFQTLYSAIGNFSKVDHVNYKRKVFLTPDGGTVAMDIAPPELAQASSPENEDVPTVVVLHGANTPVTSPQLYSASKTADLESALLLLGKMYPKSPLMGLGFSLGGAIMAKYLGEAGTRTPLIGAVCVGAPFQVDETSKALESSAISRVYSRAMGQNLMNVLRRHVDTLALLPSLWGILELGFAEKIKPASQEPLPQPDKNGPARGTLRFVDHYITGRIGGYPAPYGEFPFESAEDYYMHASPANVLHKIARPTLALNADDDPIVPLKELDSVHIALKKNPNLILAHSKHGGHLGWFASLSAVRWVHNPVGEFLAALLQQYEEAKHSDPTQGLGSGGPSLSYWSKNQVNQLQVQVEILPVSALPPILAGVSPKTHAEADVPKEATRANLTTEPQHAWLLTQVLDQMPLVHPKDSPKRQAQPTQYPLQQGKILNLTMVRHQLTQNQVVNCPEIGFLELPDDAVVGT
ncbi:hypothetical protein MPSI1_000799 [Malassezia psittaci]|uniref:AB hydrolase-1 domain-containing protein n=1 Tax=Malassezia psittaci TaxID=1821823 RepID=A0AAF0F3M1_9BASI|nr:hypothetical protein MPSI1_000799 [Malassezia psittaci]